MIRKIPLSKPEITDQDRKEVLKVLRTSFLSLGPELEKFENKFAQIAGVKYAVATNSGTSALHLIIRALGIGSGDEVITTPFSFVASSNCILYEGATPIFVDIRKDTFNIDASKIEEKITEKTKAILAVDVFAHPADWNELEKIAQKHNLFLIEDSAEALGSEYHGKKCGSFGQAGVFAFYPNKQITAGEGGVVLTNDKKLADLCRSMANQGREAKDGKWLEHIMLGYNYRLDEMSCALGISQIKRLNKIIGKRAKIARLYDKKLAALKEIEIPFVEPGNKLSRFVYVVKLSNKLAGVKRNEIIKKMAARGIVCSDYFHTIHLQPFYKKKFGYKEGDFPIAEDISQRTLALPFFNSLSEKDINFIVKNLEEVINKINGNS